MKTLLITGASRGIGKATAEKFLSEGWGVIGTSTDGSGWNHTNLTWVQLNVADPSSIQKATEQIKKIGSIDVLINNAGINAEEEDYDGAIVLIESLRRTLEVNLIGLIDFTEHILAASLIQNGGHIISLGSGWGSLTEDKGDAAPSYSISKAALSMYTKRLSVRLKPNDITVSIFSPGWTRTDMGGGDAPRSAEEPATELFNLATRDVPSGRFWEKNEERSW